MRTLSGASLTQIAATSCIAAIAGYTVIAVGSSPPSLGGSVAIAVLGIFLAVAFVMFAFARPVDLFLWGWMIFVLQEPIRAYAAHVTHQAGVIASRVDDATLAVLLCVVIARWLAGNRQSAVAGFPAGLVALAFGSLGVASALAHWDIGPWTIVGTWLSLKFWLALFIGLHLPWKDSDVDRASKYVIGTAVIVSALGVVDYLSPGSLSALLHTPPIEADPLEPSRAHAVQSVFTSPSRYSNFMSVAVAVSLARYVVRHKRVDLALAFFFAVMGLASLRLRGLFAVAAVVVILISLLRQHRTTRVIQFGLVLGFAVMILGSAAFTSQFTKFTTTPDQTARGKLYTNAAKLSYQSFPLGVGFGRYGSYASVLYYSPYYDSLGMSDYYGFSRMFPHYLTDTSWSGYLAEAGILGASAFIAGLILLALRLKAVLKRSSGPKRTAAITALALLAATVAMSVGSAAMMDSVVVVSLAMFVGPALRLQASSRDAQARDDQDGTPQPSGAVR